jgi:hypothetical protein
MRQIILTFITEIDPLKKAELEQILQEIRNDLLTNTYIPFSSLSLLHFASFVISDDKSTPPLLVFENNFDGEVSAYLDELMIKAGSGLHRIYQCCSAYKNSVFQPQNLKEFLTANIVRPNAFHIGNVGRASKDIKANQLLREKLQSYLDDLFNSVKHASITSGQLRQQMQQFVKKEVDPVLSATLPPHQTFAEKFIPRLKIILFAILALALLPLVLLSAIIIVVILRRKEDTDPILVQPPSVSDIELLISTENRITQNHLASITNIKPGKFRLYLLTVALFGANLLARTSTKGKLSGIPSIHFAHWSIINHGKQLLFLSNYDGSWTSYLDDFIDKAARGLTGIWSNTQGFPYTKFLVLDGARDELRFKAFARNQQVPSLVWYSAYRDLTVQNIDKDSSIRENIFTALSDPETKDWLKLF